MKEFKNKRIFEMKDVLKERNLSDVLSFLEVFLQKLGNNVMKYSNRSSEDPRNMGIMFLTRHWRQVLKDYILHVFDSFKSQKQ